MVRVGFDGFIIRKLPSLVHRMISNCVRIIALTILKLSFNDEPSIFRIVTDLIDSFPDCGDAVDWCMERLALYLQFPFLDAHKDYWCFPDTTLHLIPKSGPSRYQSMFCFLWDLASLGSGIPGRDGVNERLSIPDGTDKNFRFRIEYGFPLISIQVQYDRVQQAKHDQIRAIMDIKSNQFSSAWARNPVDVATLYPNLRNIKTGNERVRALTTAEHHNFRKTYQVIRNNTLFCNDILYDGHSISSPSKPITRIISTHSGSDSPAVVVNQEKTTCDGNDEANIPCNTPNSAMNMKHLKRKCSTSITEE